MRIVIVVDDQHAFHVFSQIYYPPLNSAILSFFFPMLTLRHLRAGRQCDRNGDDERNEERKDDRDP